MRVLIATPLYPPDDGGPATRAIVLEGGLPARGVSVCVVSFSDYRRFPKGISHFRFFLELLKSAKTADVMYALDPVSVGLPATIVSLISGVPLALSVVGDYAWEQGQQRSGVKESLDDFVKKYDYPVLVRFFRFIQTRVAHHAKKVITPSRYLRGIVVAWGIHEEKISVVYNAFSLNMPLTSKEILRNEFDMRTPTIISVGRFVPWKGFKVLMDAVATLRVQIPEITLLIAGSGDDSEYVGYAREHHYDFVKFLGLVEHAELMRRIRAADCFALNTGYEGLSHLLLETMAVETPIVTTHVGGNIELFERGDHGTLVPYDDHDALVGALREIFVDTVKTKRHVEHARQFVAQFSEEKMIDETLSELTSLIKT